MGTVFWCRQAALSEVHGFTQGPRERCLQEEPRGSSYTASCQTGHWVELVTPHKLRLGDEVRMPKA